MTDVQHLTLQDLPIPHHDTLDLHDLTSEWSLWTAQDPIHSPLIRKLDDRRYVAIIPFIYTWGLVWGYLDEANTYEDRWCYETLPEALLAAEAWEGTGDPDGWHRHPASGRRRDGDREWVNP